MRSLVISFLATLVLSWILMPPLIRRLLRSRIMDIPNQRSSHSRPIPRGGGLGIIGPALAGLAVFAMISPLGGSVVINDFNLVLVIGIIVLGAIGLLDDIYSLAPALRLLIQILLIGVCLIHADLGLETLTLPGLGVWYPDTSIGDGAGLMLSLILVVGFTNMFNFMDGINGLAGFQTLIGTGSMAALGYLTGNMALALPMALLCGGAIGFLRLNFPRARVFMGDVGSLPLGFALSMGALQAHQGGPEDLPLWLPLLLIWPFLFDATFTLLNRVLHGRNPIEAHRSHLYQRLIVVGWSHTRVTGLYLGGMVVCVVSAFLCHGQPDYTNVFCRIVFWSLCVFSLIWAIGVSNLIRAERTSRPR